MTKSMSVLEFVTSDDGGRPRVVQMQNLYDLTMDPPKEHAIPIQITTRRKDGRHITSTTNTFAVAEAARTRASSALGINKRDRDKPKPNRKFRPSSSRSKLMSSPHRRKRSVSPSHQGHPVSPLPLGALQAQVQHLRKDGGRAMRPQTPPRRPQSAQPSDKPDATHQQSFSVHAAKSKSKTPRASFATSPSTPKEKKKSKGKIKVSRVQRMLSAKANADRARTATVVDDENQQGLDFGDYRPPLTASAPSNIEGKKARCESKLAETKDEKICRSAQQRGQRRAHGDRAR